MKRSEILLVMTVCELLGQSKTIPDIERAHLAAQKNLDRYERNQAKSHPPHRD